MKGYYIFYLNNKHFRHSDNSLTTNRLPIELEVTQIKKLNGRKHSQKTESPYSKKYQCDIKFTNYNRN